MRDSIDSAVLGLFQDRVVEKTLSDTPCLGCAVPVLPALRCVKFSGNVFSVPKETVCFCGALL